MQIDSTNVADPNFKDVKKKDWYYKEVAALVKLGVLSGYKEDQTFKPNKPITRGEMAKMIVTAYDLKTSDGKTRFTDVDAKAWYAPFVKSLVDHNITQGKTAKTFEPNSLVTRGEAVTFVYRTETETESGQQTVDIEKVE